MAFLKVNTAVTSEPITLTELKRHLRIYDDGYNDTQSEMITTRSAGAGNITGTGIDIQGCEATVYINVGVVAAGGTLDAKIQHSDDNITYTDWTYGTFTQIVAAGQTSKEYTGNKRYIRVYATVAVNTVTFGANVQILAGDPVVDAELSNIITRAREQAEEMTRLSFAPQMLEYGLDSFPAESHINLPRPPLSSVTTVKTYDSVGTPTTLTVNTQYLVDVDSTPGRITLPYSGTWPSNADYPNNPVRIVYVAGYTTLPQKLKTILLYHCGLIYKYRDVAIPENDKKTLEQMYNFYRMSWFGGELVR